MSPAERLTDLNASLLGDKPIAEVESFTFVSNDNKFEVEAFLTKPVGLSQSGKYPLIVNIHGGPHGQQGPAFNFKNQVYAAHGWATLMVNYRGSTGYGQAFADAVFGDQNGNEGQDVLYGVSAAMRRYPWIDRDRLGVEGTSYGGQLSTWLLTQTNIFKAAIPTAAITNMISYNYMTYYNQYEAMELGAYPHQGNLMDTLLERSSIRHVANAQTPTMLMHGENDNDVPIAESEQFYIALKDVGVEVVMVRYPREGHGIRESKHVVDRSIARSRGTRITFRRSLRLEADTRPVRRSLLRHRARRHSVHRSRLHLMVHAGHPGRTRARGGGARRCGRLDFQRLHDRVRAVRDANGLAGRPIWTANDARTCRALVVLLHRRDGVGLEPRVTHRGAVPLRDGRGRMLPESHARLLDVAAPRGKGTWTKHSLARREMGRRVHAAACRRRTVGGVVAGVVLDLRVARRGVGRRFLPLVSRRTGRSSVGQRSRARDARRESARGPPRPSTRASSSARGRRGCSGAQDLLLQLLLVLSTSPGCRSFEGQLRCGSRQGLSAMLAGIPLFAGGLGNLVAGRIMPGVAERLGAGTARRVLPIGGFALAALMLVFVAHHLDEPLIVMGAMGLASFFGDSCTPCAWGACMDVGGRFSGTYSGSMNMMGNLRRGRPDCRGLSVEGDRPGLGARLRAFRRRTSHRGHLLAVHRFGHAAGTD